MVTIYFDVCCLKRPFDDQSQERVRLESESVLLILRRVERGLIVLVGSEMIYEEIQRTPDPDRRDRLSALVQSADRSVLLSDAIEARACEFEPFGIEPFDALHLASAEAVPAELFLTTDDRLLRSASRVAHALRVRVLNPLDWLREVKDP